jgi:hypothetical protein
MKGRSRIAHFPISNFQFLIGDWWIPSAIADKQSKIKNQKSKIKNQKLKIKNWKSEIEAPLWISDLMGRSRW